MEVSVQRHNDAAFLASFLKNGRVMGEGHAQLTHMNSVDPLAQTGSGVS